MSAVHFGSHSVSQHVLTRSARFDVASSLIPHFILLVALRTNKFADMPTDPQKEDIAQEK